MTEPSSRQYANEFSDAGFWENTCWYQCAGENALRIPKLYYSARGPTPASNNHNRSALLFQQATDAIPDLTPVLGFSDDWVH